MKNNCAYISILDLIRNFKKCSLTNQTIGGYNLYLFAKLRDKQNYTFKGHFSLSSNIRENDVFEVDYENWTELRLFIKQNDKENSLNFFLKQIDRQSTSDPMISMQTLEFKGFVRFDGKIENGELDSLVCGPKSIKFYKQHQYIDILNAKTEKQEKQAWNDSLSEIEKKNNAEGTDYKSTSIGDKLKIAKNQIQKENNPMLENNFINHKVQ